MTNSLCCGARLALRTTKNRTDSPITPFTLAVTTAMAFGSYGLALAWNVRFASLPNPLPLILAAVAIDIAAGQLPDSRIARATHAATFAILHLGLASIAGVLAAYAGQRLQMPLRDDLFTQLDRAIGFDWDACTRWIDRHPILAHVLSVAYATMPAQIALPAVVLAFTGDQRRLRTYLLAFSLGLALTAVVSAMAPALSPIATIRRDLYQVLTFSGATPLAHLKALRGTRPAVIGGDLGGIISFPSFHATVAVLTPVALGRYRLAVAILVPIDALMLCAAVSEGAHYASDVIAGVGVALLAFAAAGRWIEGGAENIDPMLILVVPQMDPWPVSQPYRG